MQTFMKKPLCQALLAAMLLHGTAHAIETPADTIKVVDVEEIVIIATPKENKKLRELPTSVTLLSQQQMQEAQVTGIKSLTAMVPNLFIPDYGSRLTSAIYIRGIGSRINTPSVGLYVDNIPYVNQSAFDFGYADVERIDVVSAEDMYRAVTERFDDVDGAIMCAAVADYTPKEVSALKIKKGESIIFSAGTEKVNTRQLNKMYEDEIKTRTPRTSFYNCMKNCAKQFYVTKPDGSRYILAGYPWFKTRARDEFIALPGATISVHHRPAFEGIMDTAKKALTAFIETGEIDKNLDGLDLPDVPLWAIWDVQQYAKDAGSQEAAKRYGKLVKDILRFIIDQKHPNLKVAENGLVTTDGTKKPMTWMDASRPDGTPIIPRAGFVVEFNALWYNALRFAQNLFADDVASVDDVKTWEELTDKIKASFIATFLNDSGYLYDYVDGYYSDPSVRPNMIIAAGLDYSPLDRRQRKSVLDFVTRELLTPKGLRTLSPNSYGYKPWYLGNPQEREEAYYQGSARPWLIGFYADAYIKVFGLSGLSFIERQMIGYEDEMSQGCIGSLSELYDGNPPYIGRGAVSFAANVSGVLRVLRMIKNIDDESMKLHYLYTV